MSTGNRLIVDWIDWGFSSMNNNLLSGEVSNRAGDSSHAVKPSKIESLLFNTNINHQFEDPYLWGVLYYLGRMCNISKFCLR